MTWFDSRILQPASGRGRAICIYQFQRGSWSRRRKVTLTMWRDNVNSDICLTGDVQLKQYRSGINGQGLFAQFSMYICPPLHELSMQLKKKHIEFKFLIYEASPVCFEFLTPQVFLQSQKYRSAIQYTAHKAIQLLSQSSKSTSLAGLLEPQHIIIAWGNRLKKHSVCVDSAYQAHMSL